MTSQSSPELWQQVRHLALSYDPAADLDDGSSLSGDWATAHFIFDDTSKVFLSTRTNNICAYIWDHGGGIPDMLGFYTDTLIMLAAIMDAAEQRRPTTEGNQPYDHPTNYTRFLDRATDGARQAAWNDDQDRTRPQVSEAVG